MRWKHPSICQACGASFYRCKKEQITCGRKCAAKARTEAATIKCDRCGKPFVRWKKTARFCGKECYGHYRSESAVISEGLRKRRDFFATKEELESLYDGRQMTQDEIAIHFGCSQRKVWGLMRYYGITTRPIGKRNQDGALNAYWKGGVIRRGRYRYIKAEGHPRAGKDGYVAEHVIVAERAIGRPILNGEHVHHLDGDKDNNSPDNLWVTDRASHAKAHNQLETIGRALFRAGLIGFDRVTGEYVLTQRLADAIA